MSDTSASAQDTIKRLFRALKAEQQKREALEARQPATGTEPVAVIGMGCRFPGGANSPDAFWQLLDAGDDAISTVPADRWDAAAFLDPEGTSAGTMRTAEGGFLDVDLGQFDYPFFRLSPREARALDPQQRLLLEVSWEALESAGIVPASLKRSRTGVYVGLSGDDYTLAHRHSGDLSRIDAYSITGSTPSTAAGRIAYVLGLEGPALPVDTACSSSLVAFHLACQSLREGETDLALAGGVNLILAPATHVCFSQLQAISPDGRCKSFDASANGYGRGEGCGVVVLKRLSDALRDHDPVLAVVKATVVNQDGASNGFTAPNGAAQKRLLREALDKAGLVPSQIQYVETHGTGTPLGDPIEVDALSEALCHGRPPDQPLLLGAVKSNIGHLEAAAGMAGLIKVLLALRHGRIPPNLHFTTPNPLIPWQDAGFRVPTKAVPWPGGADARHAGISSFGFSGTNAHVILGEPPAPTATPLRPAGPYLLCLSARTTEALGETATRFISWLRHPATGVSAYDVCATALRHRSHFPHRLAVTGNSLSELADALANTTGNANIAAGLQEAAARYLGGGEPDADTLAPPGSYNRVDLPTTGFSPLPCRIGDANGLLVPAPTIRNLPVFALLDREWRSPLLSDVLWESRISLGSHPLFHDHRVFAQPVVPAAAYLSMMLAAAARYWPDRALDLTDIVFPAALVLPERGAETLHLRLRPIDDGSGEDRGELRLVRLTADGPVLHASAGVWAVASAEPEHEPAAARWASLSTAITPDELFATQGDRLTLGPAFRRITGAKTTQGEALATLQAQGDDDTRWLPSLHPGIIDAGLQLLPALWNQTGSDAMVPVGIARLRVPAPLSASPSPASWAAATLTTTRNTAGVAGGDVRFLSGDGQLLIALEGVQGLAMSAQSLLRATGADRDIPCYHTVWHPVTTGGPQATPQADPATDTGQSGQWIVLAQDGPQDAILPDAILPDAIRLTDPAALALTIAELGPALSGVVLLCPASETQDLSLAVPALMAAQSLAALDTGARLWIVTRGAQAIQPGDDANPSQAALWGLGRSLAMEQPRLWGGLVDLPASPGAADREHLATLLRAADHQDNPPTECALRDGHMLVPRLERLALAGNGNAPIRPGVTQLVTGGWGALGLELAEWLCARGASHLALLGRGTPSASAQGRIDALIAGGAQVRLFRADMTQHPEVASAITAIDADMPPLGGVFHLAGVLRDGLLADQSAARLSEVMAVKAGGAETLDQLLGHRPLDCMVFFSSSAATLGAAGQANYAAANAFLDALATRRRHQGKTALSIAWGPWSGTGMAASTGATRKLEQLGLTALAPDTAFATLAQLLAADRSTVAVLPVDWRRYRRALPTGVVPEGLRDLLPAADLPRSASAGLDPADLTRFLTRIAADALGSDAGTAIDETQDLFELGLDSLMALRMRNAIEAGLGVALSSTALFDYPTIAGLRDALSTAQQGNGGSDTGPATDTDNKPVDHSRLGSGQAGLWFLQQLAPESAAFHTCFTARIRSDLDIDLLEQAFRQVLDRHPPLRARFTELDGVPRQDALDARHFAIERVDVPQDGTGDSAEALRGLVDAAYRRPFRLELGPPIRVVTWRRADDDHVLLIAVHHIAIDVWSFERLLDEVKRSYAALIRGEMPDLPPAGRSHAEFIGWQHDQLAGSRGNLLRNHWRDRLAGAPPAGAPPLSRLPAGPPTLTGHSFHFELDRERTAALERSGQENGVTLTMLLLAAWLLLVGRLAGRDDVIVGTPALGRSERAWADAIGFFVNVLPIRADLTDNPTWLELLHRVRRAVLDAIAHQDLPFAEIAAQAPETDRDGLHPLFTTLFHLRNLEEMGPFANAFVPDRTARIPFGALELEPFFLDQQEGQYPLTMEWFKTDGILHGVLKYDTDHYDLATATALTEHYRVLLDGLMDQPEARVRSVSLLTGPDRTALALWNATDRPSQPFCIHHRIARQASLTPDAVAVVASGQSITYAMLDQRANALSHDLIARGLGKGQLAGLCAERSIGMVIALLAILKAGAAYVPLSPDDPAERLAALATGANLTLVLVQPDSLDRFAALAPRCLVVLGEATGERVDAPDTTLSPDDLIYTLFTSGTTGTPKGVAVAHDSVANIIDWLHQTLQITADDAVLGKTPLTFDPSVTEIFLPLALGARLILADAEGHRDPGHLVALIAREGVSIALTVPSQWQIWLDEPGIADCQSLRWVGCGGEPLPAALIRRFRHMLPDTALANVYGPTEATVFVSSWLCPDDTANDAAVLIGSPIANCRLYVLDEALAQLPIGVPGMLYIGGRCLAQGYLGQPQLTEQSFVPDPFAGRDGARMYRTGDRACLIRTADGLALRFLGRVDNQVKLRGMRLETDEVEAVLCAHPAIAQAVVRPVTAPSGETVLGALLVPAKGTELAEDTAPAYLETRLPGWMVPRLWSIQPALPLTAHGKTDSAMVDRHLRTAMDRRITLQPSAAPLPATALPIAATERRVAALWCELLNLPSVGRGDHFFDLGGTSLMLARLRRRLEEEGFGPVPMLELFRHPTLASLCAHLSGTAAVDSPLSAPVTSPARNVIANHTAGDHAIAVIGMAARVPGAADIDAFWDNLIHGVESIRRFSRDELLAAGVPPELADDPAYVPANGTLDGVDEFDAGFFGYSPREAETLDPQHRLFLESVWHALEHGGYGKRGLTDRVGVYAGAETSTYLLFNLAHRLDKTELNGGYGLSLANDKDFLATRASYTLDLRGPGLTVQTACSTSLTAVAMACDALVAGRCDMALAGGVSIQLPQIQGYRHSEGMVASRDGHCRPFDAEAAGTVNGNGVGVVLLKPLARALADGDTVHAVLKGWAINNDGSQKLGYTAPNADAQARALAEAWAHAGIAPADLHYIEAHGTGTPLGDPIEVAGLIQAWGDRPHPPEPRALGSVKGNIGHLGAASGVAGLIKTVLSVREGRIAPSLHLHTPNPRIPFAGSPFTVASGLRDWPAVSGARRAGVSSFGIGGTNVHMVVEQAPPARPLTDTQKGWHILPLSAGSRGGLDRLVQDVAARLRGPDAPAIAEVAFTLQEGRSAFSHRTAVLARNTAQASVALTSSPVVRADAPPEVAFLFPGQGAQHPGMLRDLGTAWPAFAREIDDGLIRLAALDGTPVDTLRLMLNPPADRKAEASAFLGQTRYTQPFLFIVEHALARLWRSFGVEPTAMMGHSVGEFVAATLAGVFTFEDALGLVAARGRLMQSLPMGAMLAVNLPASEVLGLISDVVSLAGDNGPTQCVLSGPTEAIREVAEQLVARGITTHPLTTSHAFHSAMMDPILNAFRLEVEKVARRAPQVPVISCLTGDWLTASQACDPDYWVQQLRGTVRFQQGIRTLLQAPNCLLLEVGPGRSLSGQVRRLAGRDGAPVLSTARRESEVVDDRESLLTTLASMWSHGAELSWSAVRGNTTGQRIPLPLYPFDRQRYWVDARPVLPPVVAAATERAEPSKRFYSPRWTPTALPPPIPETDEGTSLIFADAGDLAALLADRLRARGGHAVIVSPDISSDACAGLLDQTRAQGSLRRIIHAGSMGASPARIHTAGLESLTVLAQALATRQAPVDLVIVGENIQDVAGDDPVPAHSALLLGPALVIPRECPWVNCRLIDLAPDNPLPTADKIIRELSDPRGDRLVAYRNRRRWVRDFQPLAITSTVTSDAPAPLRRGGVYLVTGGLGGIGLEIARFLGRNCQARLVLCGRNALSPDDPRNAILREIENGGGSITTMTADVSDPEAMSMVVARIMAEHGALHGVIHAAGLADHGAITTKTPASMARILAPKVEGTLVLADALNGIALDFLALFSSSSAVLGSAGLMDYVAANAFLDAFAHRRSAAGLPTFAIGWDAWANTGLSRNASPGTISRKQAAQALSTADGIDAFSRILTQPGLPHIIVSPTDLNQMLGAIAAAAGGPEPALPDTPVPPALHDRPDLATSFVAAANPVQQRIAALWQDALGVKVVGIRDNFFDLGGDSLMGARLVARLNGEFAATLPAVILYEAPTVEMLALRLAAPDGATAGPAKPAPDDSLDMRKDSRRSRRDRKRDDFIP